MTELFEGSTAWVAKFIGSLCGVIISLVMIAPEGTKNAFYRMLLGTIGGVIFAHPMQGVIPFLGNAGLEDHLAAGCFTGFTIWFILEAIARMLASKKTMTRLLEEIIRLRGKD